MQPYLIVLYILLVTANFASAKTPEMLAGSIPLNRHSKSEDARLSKISLQDAIVIANKEVPGKVVEAALEQEGGYLVFEVEIVTDAGTKREVLIDAGNGSILGLKEKKIKRHHAEEE